MAYATGSAATANALLTALATFAGAQGWTIVKNTTGLLFLSKGVCFVALQTNSYNYNDFATGSSVSTPDVRLECALSTSLTVGLNTFFGHPGSLSTTATDTDRVSINNLLGPFSEYHFFAANNYIHVSVKTGSDTWRQFGFGEVDKGALTHGGAAFLTGSSHAFFRQSTAAANSTANQYNDPSACDPPYARNGNTSPSRTAGAQANFYVPDALPATADWPIHTTACVPQVAPVTEPVLEYPNNGSAPTPRILNPMMLAQTSQWGGNVALFPIPIFIAAPTILRSCYIGDYPDIRLINMEGLLSGQELALGSDVWKVFSLGRQLPWASKTVVGFQFSTGQLGLAFKKIP
jgi:hypothetical protein